MNSLVNLSEKTTVHFELLCDMKVAEILHVILESKEASERM